MTLFKVSKDLIDELDELDEPKIKIPTIKVSKVTFEKSYQNTLQKHNYLVPVEPKPPNPLFVSVNLSIESTSSNSGV